MKKFLYYASLFIISFSLMLISNKIVFAANCDNYHDNECRITANRTIIVAGNWQNYRNLEKATSTSKIHSAYPKYSSINIRYSYNPNATFNIYRDNNSSLYCFDPQFEGDSTLYAYRFLQDTNESKKVQIMDYAMLSILTNDGKETVATNNSDYWARLMAIRGLIFTFGFYNTGNIEYERVFYAGLTAVNEWLKDSSIKTLYDDLNHELEELKQDKLKDKSAFAENTTYTFTGNTLSTAKEYYKRALQKAIDYAKKMSESPKITDMVEASNIKTSKVNNNNIFVSKDVTHTITVSGISKNSSNSFIINGIKFEEGTKYDGLSHSITSIKIIENKDGENLETNYNTPDTIKNILSKNLLETHNFKEESKIIITVHFEGWQYNDTGLIEKLLQCNQQPIKYYIDGTYSINEYGEYNGYVGTVWYSGYGKDQRYVGVEKKDSVSLTSSLKTWRSSYETYLLNGCGSCDDLEQACINTKNINSDECKELLNSNCGNCSMLNVQCELSNNLNSDACKSYNEECESTGVSCGTKVDTLECCDEYGDLIVWQENDLDTQTHEVSIIGASDETGTENVNACFVTNINNQKIAELGLKSYEQTGYNKMSIGTVDDEGNSYTLDQNKYCVVSCKEDYTMTMPTAKRVNAGRYFDFKMTVEGTKSCYTNTIDTEQYNKDMNEILTDIAEALSEYNKYKTVIDSLNKSESIIKNKYKNYEISNNSSGLPYCNLIEQYDGYQNEFKYIYYEYNAGDKKISAKEGGTYKYTDDYIINNDTEVINYIEKNIIPNNGRITDGGESEKCELNQLATITFKYPVFEITGKAQPGNKDKIVASLNMYKEYWEKRYNELANKYNDLVQDYQYCKTGNWSSTIKYEPTIYYDDQENYSKNNTNNMKEQLNENSNNIITYYSDGYSRSINNSKTSITFATFCEIGETSDCGGNYYKTDSKQIPNANYIKKTSTIKATYKPKTLYYNIYPNGKITTNANDDNSVALTNKVPVALNTKRGIYKYAINITNLGEFYRTGRLGRLIGSDKAVINKKDYDFVSGNTAVYSCAYLVNIKESEGWVCDFDNDCTNNCVSNCIGEYCDGYCDGNNCSSDCIGLGCIYDEDAGSSLVEKTVSLNKLFPNGTNSYNWDVDKNAKAKETVKAIEEKGTSIYEETPILSITINSQSAREIRSYNKAQENENKGGYSNDTITCKDLNGNSMIACYSSFIESIISTDESVNFGVVINENSKIQKDNDYRENEINDDPYFTSWSGTPSEASMIGPAWK